MICMHIKCISNKSVLKKLWYIHHHWKSTTVLQQKTPLLSGSHKIAFLREFWDAKSFQMSLIPQIYFSKK